MHYLLILYLISYSIETSITMQMFDSKSQCEAVREHVVATHGYYRDSECYPVPEK